MGYFAVVNSESQVTKKGTLKDTLSFYLNISYLPNLIEAWAAASLAIGTLKGEQLT